MARAPSPRRQSRIPAEWLTVFETSNRERSPRYDESIDYFSRLARESGKARLFTYGVSPQGRPLHCLVVAKGNEFDPDAARASGKPVVLVQNGIHPGEIDGKDACMLLLRDILITREQERLIDDVIVLVVPVVNPDGHERVGRGNRPNQNGPVEMGWRTTAHNLNLNRDYMKADAPEMRALLSLYAAWRPDFLVDHHTTDGADYRYHVTYGIERHENIDPALSEWGTGRLLPFIVDRVEKNGFLVAPYIDMRTTDLHDGIVFLPALPRYSTGYLAAQNRLSLLVETHSLKPFGTRVLAAKAMTEAVLECVGAHAAELKDVTRIAEHRAVRWFAIERRPFPLEIEVTDEAVPFTLKGFEAIEVESPVTGAPVVHYTSRPVDFDIPLFAKAEVEASVKLPAAYCIPPEFRDVTERLRVHGIEVGELGAAFECAVERYRFLAATFARRPSEGRLRVDFELARFKAHVNLAPGTFVVPTAQRAVRVLAHLLEPRSPDSFVRWGFFNAFFERKEYIEPYALEPVAREMLERDPDLAREFLRRLEEDDAFRHDPAERLEFFYERSLFHDSAENVYPIMRIWDARTFSRLSRVLARRAGR